MKKILVLALFACILLSLTSCSLFGLLFPNTSLTIKNDSSIALEFVKWNNIYFGDDSVWEPLVTGYVSGLNPGGSDTKDLDEGGSSYIYFEFQGDITDYRTTELVTVDDGEEATFTFYDSMFGLYQTATMEKTNTITGAKTRQTLTLVPTEDARLHKAAKVRESAQVE